MSSDVYPWRLTADPQTVFDSVCEVLTEAYEIIDHG